MTPGKSSARTPPNPNPGCPCRPGPAGSGAELGRVWRGPGGEGKWKPRPSAWRHRLRALQRRNAAWPPLPAAPVQQTLPKHWGHPVGGIWQITGGPVAPGSGPSGAEGGHDGPVTVFPRVCTAEGTNGTPRWRGFRLAGRRPKPCVFRHHLTPACSAAEPRGREMGDPFFWRDSTGSP